MIIILYTIVDPPVPSVHYSPERPVCSYLSNHLAYICKILLNIGRVFINEILALAIRVRIYLYIFSPPV
jgi:hypothetical protein